MAFFVDIYVIYCDAADIYCDAADIYCDAGILFHFATLMVRGLFCCNQLKIISWQQKKTFSTSAARRGSLT